jgi:hypothetical protein
MPFPFMEFKNIPGLIWEITSILSQRPKFEFNEDTI